jgi:hypothetical protein
MRLLVASALLVALGAAPVLAADEMSATAPALPSGPAMVHVNILAKEFTYGPGGTDAPLLLEYTVSGGSWTGLFDDLPVAAGQRVAIPFDAGVGHLVFRVVGPNGAFLSNGKNAIVLRDGDHLEAFLRMDHVSAPLGSQKTVAACVAPYLDAKTGNITLRPEQILILFEAGTTDPNDPAYDFQDLVLMVSVDDLRAVAAIPRQVPGDPVRPN